MMVLAFQADLTRVCSFMIANDGSNVPYKQIGVAEGPHDLSHHGRDPLKQEKLQKINTFHIQQLAYILEKMQSIKEDDGTMPANTILVYAAVISDSDRHNHDDPLFLLAGRGGGS